MKYPVQLQEASGMPIIPEIIEADDDNNAYEKAKEWAASLAIEGAWLVVKNSNGTFKSFGPADIFADRP